MNYIYVNENEILISYPSERHHMKFSDQNVWIIPFKFHLRKSLLTTIIFRAHINLFIVKRKKIQ